MTGALTITPPLVGEFVLAPFELAQAADPVQAYLDTLGEGSAETMRSSLRTIAKLIGAPSAEAIPWGAWRYQHTAHVRSLLEQLGPESWRTANRHMAALKGVLRAAKKMGLLSAQDHADAVDVKPIAGEDDLPGGRELTQAELVALFGACDLRRPRGLQQGLVLGLLFGGGLRLSEPTRLRPEDYERSSGKLSVRGKGNKKREVQLPEGARRAAEAWLAIRGDWPGPLLAPVRGDRVLQRGLTPRALAKRITALAERAGVLELQSHDFRRSYATALFRLHVDPLLICGLMGHASLDTTMRYDYRPTEARAEAANRLHVPYPEKR